MMQDDASALPPPSDTPAAQSQSPEAILQSGTYGQILRSTALVGGGAVVVVALGIVRTKAMAVLIGPSGMGLFSLFSSVADLARNVFGMGVSSSAVRQIAEAAGTGDQCRIGMTVAVLRRVSVGLSVLATAAILALARPLSRWTFGTDEYYLPTALLSLVVFFRIVSDSQGALLQGLRRISELTKATVIGAVSGTALSLILVFLYRESGVVPSLVAVAIMSLSATWWYSRGNVPATSRLRGTDVEAEAGALLRWAPCSWSTAC